ncbi:M56 family metallopeptidase [Mongoliitalea daihaiensis]|uniref:M56 family metallopeptidase n=1 Tax=Mongoliitalea daihaiensis TaxID=2782006 RepID=UPI001F241921|nr:M56 family metallopeptidase [Mongoliitalea daihaiensis]UJP66535.1 M48 family metalloprotease [Mongoliitalea daihaiensis]
MGLYTGLIAPQIQEAFGWMLIHSIWQITVVGLFFWGLLFFGKNLSATKKYIAGMICLGLIPLIAAITFTWHIDLTFEKTIESFTSKVASEAVLGSTFMEADNPSNTHTITYLEKYMSPYLLLIVKGWIFGLILFLLRTFMGWSSLRNLRQKPVEQLDEQWQELFDRVLKTTKLSSLVGIYSSKFVSVPLTFGVWKPIILIPAALLLQMNPCQLEAILMHELAHIKRRDYLWNFLQVMTENIFFFHPICWWITTEIRRQRELAADEWAIAHGVAPKELAYGLATAAAFQQHHAVPEFALAASKSKHPTLERIKKLLGVHSSPSQPTTLTTCTMITTIIISVFLLGMNQPVNSLPSNLNEEVSVKQLFAELLELRDTIPPIPDTLTIYLREPGAVPTVDIEMDYPSDMPIKMLSFEWPDFSNMPIVSFEPVSLIPSIDLSGLSNLNGFASLPQVSFQPIPDLQLKPISIKPLKPISIPTLNGLGTLGTPSDTTKSSRKVQSFIIHGLSDTLVWDSKNLHAKIVKADSVVVFPFFKVDSLSKRQTFDFQSFQKNSLFNGKEIRETHNFSYTIDSLGIKNLFSDSLKMNQNGLSFYFKDPGTSSLEEIQKQLKAKQKENEQKFKEQQESFKTTFEELQKQLLAKQKENQQKIKEWQESNKPALEELQEQLKNWQKENEQKMKEWQQQLKLLQEELLQLQKEQGKSGKN